jgi:two-component system sensor histidine kinase KdpD
MFQSTARKIGIKNIIIQLSITLIINVSTTLLSLLIKHIGFTEVNIVIIYILSVLITSRYTQGYVYGIVASIVSMLTFNFFFTIPIYTFKVDDSSYIFTFMIMFLSAIFTSTLTSKLIRSKELADAREKQAHILYRITSALAKTSEVSDVAAVSAQCLSNLLECDVFCIIIDSKMNKANKITVEKDTRGIISTTLNTNEIENAIAHHYSFPIKVHDRIISFIGLPKELENMNNENLFLLDSIIIQITIAMERELLITEKETAKTETERERFKSNLLRAISHDLRTPLTRITGSAQMLQHNLKNDENVGLAIEIYEDSTWLTRLVENILSLTRIQEGKLAINIQLEAVEEIVAESIYLASKYSPNHKITIAVPDEVLFVPMHGKLIEQVLINLIDNAIDHTAPSNDIKVSIWVEHKKVWFEVADNGCGISEEDLPKIFDMFFVSDTSRTNSNRGMGLGLAICKAIITLHGGEIYAQNNISGGATFKFYLNLEGVS